MINVKSEKTQKEEEEFAIKRQNIRTLSLVVFTLIYLLTGAAVFDKLESSTEEKYHEKLNEQIRKFRQNINMTNEQFELLYKHMVLRSNHRNDIQWNLWGSFYFCTLTLALIGYGHSTPATFFGKLFCIFYSLFGIPISLIMFQSVGERLNGFLRYLIKCFKNNQRVINIQNKEVSNKDLIMFEFFLTAFLVLNASYVFSTYENWSYFDSLYYSFITLTTIGFGDFVPLQKNNYLKTKPVYVTFTVLFIMTGLTILASSTNLLVLYIVNINSEENLRKRMRLQQKKKEQLQKMLIGDVIKSANKQDIVTYMDEMPNLAALEEISVCSCEDITNCYKTYKLNWKNEKKSKKLMKEMRYENKKFLFIHHVHNYQQAQGKISNGAKFFSIFNYKNKNHKLENEQEQNFNNSFVNDSCKSRNMLVKKRTHMVNMTSLSTSTKKIHFSVLRQPCKQITHLTRHYDNKSDYVLKFMDKNELSIKRLLHESQFISPANKKIARRHSC